MTVEPGWADQDAARTLIAMEPNLREIVRANRAFLGRAVRFLARKAGIRQFLDIGSGIPTSQPVHETARQAWSAWAGAPSRGAPPG